MLRVALTLCVFMLTFASVVAFADEGDVPAEATKPAPAAEADKADTPNKSDQPAEAEAGEKSAEDVLNDLLKRRDENPLIEPTPHANPKPRPVTPDRPAPPAVKGLNPQVDKVQLKREGEFVVTRRGRIVRAAGGSSPWLFAFESDASGLSDPPMYLMPCRLLEEMEAMVEQYGDDAVFTVSGQVFVYRGSNHLLPTLMKLAPNRGNLQP